MTAAMFDQMGRGVVAAAVLECLAIGVVVMASIQAVRGVVPVRGVFHRQCMVRWLSRPTKLRQLLDQRLDKANSLYALYSPPPSLDTPKRRVERLPEPEVAVVHLLDLATTGSRQDVTRADLAFFDLPLEQLCGQVSVGAERAIIEPDTNAPLLVLLSGPGGVEDVFEFLKQHAEQAGPVPPLPTSEEKQPPRPMSPMEWEEAEKRERLEAERVERSEAARLDAFMRARSKVEECIRRHIDQLQIDAAYAWKQRLRGLAIALSGALGIVSALTSQRYAAILPIAIVAAILGGFFATVSRDLVAIIERLRR
jgi:hypothetical protein